MTRTGTLRSIISVTFWKSVGMGLSLVIALAIANLFGAGAVTDAFFFARRLVSTTASSLERAFHLMQVPPMVQLAERQGLAAMAAHLRRRFWLTFWVALAVSLAACLLAPQIIGLLAPGFSEDQRAPAILFFRILVLVLPLSAATALSGAVLSALRLFRLPVIARLLPRAAAALALALVPLLGYGLGGVVWAIAGGTVAMALFFALCVRHALAQDWTPSAAPAGVPQPFTSTRFWAMLLGHFHMIGASWIDLGMASLAGAGGVATLEYAQRMANMAPGIVTNSVVLVYYTEFASHAGRGDRAALRDSLQASMRASLIFVLPAAVALLVLAEPLVAVLLGHGAFEPWAVRQTALIITALAPLLVVNALQGTLASAIFADPCLPHLKIMATATGAALAVRLGLNWLLLPHFGVVAVPLSALAAMSTLLVVVYIWLARALGPPLRWRETGPYAAMALSAALAGAAAHGLWQAGGRGLSGRIEVLAMALLTAGVTAGVFLIAATLLRVPETARIRSALARVMSRSRA